MKILKEGRTRTRLFACKSCGCEFELTEREVNENTTFEGNEIIKVKTFICLQIRVERNEGKVIVEEQQKMQKKVARHLKA